MHPQSVAFFDLFEALPAKIGILKNERRVRFLAGEAAPIREGMDD